MLGEQVRARGAEGCQAATALGPITSVEGALESFSRLAAGNWVRATPNVGNDRRSDSYIGLCKKYLTAAIWRKEVFRLLFGTSFRRASHILARTAFVLNGQTTHMGVRPSQLCSE